MKATDYPMAAGVAVAVIALTMALSFPMVWVYATLIEPGRPQAFYNEAAKGIAPWSSYILGPLLFCVINTALAIRRSHRNAALFATICFGFYVLIDFGMIALAGGSIVGALTPTMALSLSAKLAGAVLGGWLGQRRHLGRGSDRGAHA